MRVCHTCGAECAGEARFCAMCGTPLDGSVPVPEPERPAAQKPAVPEARRTCTILFGDIVGSTALAERTDPETVRRVVTRVLELGRSVVEKHEGIVERFAGDALMAVFGLPEARTDDALRAVRTASELLERLSELNLDTEQQWGVAIRLRIGVNTGEVATGNPFADEIFVTGDAVNVAARLEQAAGPMEIVIGQQTYDLVERDVETEPIEPLSLKGKSEPVPAYRVVRVARTEAFRRIPLVGRSGELARLEELFEEACSQSRCLIATVVGPPGIGKTRLVEEFLDSLPSKTTVMRGVCLSYEGGGAYLPIAQALRGLLARDDASPEVVRDRIGSILGGTDDAAEIEACICDLMGLADQPHSPAETNWALRRFCEQVAVRYPLVIYVDDVHWGSELLLETLLQLVEHVRSEGMLIICTERMESVPKDDSWSARTTRLELGPLQDGACFRAAREFLGGEVASNVLQRVREVAQGNPLFVQAIATTLVRDGRVENREGMWVATGDLSAAPVPTSIQSVLGAEIDGLKPLERSVLERASIIGDVFYINALLELVRTETRVRLGEILAELERQGLIQPVDSDLPLEEAFRFSHGLVRDVAEQRLRRSDRAYLHERFADWLESRHADVAETAGIAGYHLEQAYLNLADLGPVDERGAEIGRRGASLLERLAIGGCERGDASAVYDFERAAALLAPDTIERARMLLVLSRFAEGAVCDAALREAQTILSLQEDAALSGIAEMTLLLNEVLRGESASGGIQKALAAAERAAEALRGSGDPGSLCYALSAAAFLADGLGRTGDSVRYGEASSAVALDAGLRGEWQEASAWAVGRRVPSGRTVQECIARGRAYLDASPDRVCGMNARAILAIHLARDGAIEEARELLREAAAIVEEFGLDISAPFFADRGAVEIYAGEWSAAADFIRRFVECCGGGSNAVVDMALAMARAERYDEALDALSGLESTADPEDAYIQAMTPAVRAFAVGAGEGPFDFSAFSRAEAALRAIDTPENLGDVLALKGECLLLVGRHDEALASLNEAIGIYDALGVRPSARRAREVASRISA